MATDSRQPSALWPGGRGEPQPPRIAKLPYKLRTFEALTERFVINFFPEREQPLWRLRFRHGSVVTSFSSWISVVIFASPNIGISGVWDITRPAPSTPIWALSDTAAITSWVIKI